MPSRALQLALLAAACALVTSCAQRPAPSTAAPPAAKAVEPAGPHRQALEAALRLPYAELFDEAPSLEIPESEIARMRREFEGAQKACVSTYKERGKSLSRELRDLERDLRRRTGDLDEEGRKNLHCSIQNKRIEQRQAELFANQVVPVAYENLRAKLDIVRYWPDEQRAIRRQLESGEHVRRRWGDVADIGFREIQPNQERDIERGKRAADELRKLGLMPKPTEDELLRRRVEEIAQRVARASDLRVPLKVEVLESPEINAFALPGGFIYIHRGLVEAAEDESQLAGVIAHEIAHVTARHGQRLMRRATIASIAYEVARIGALIATGGAIGLAGYYALEYGFYGLGLALSLDLLGVSREFELEADQLGVQYAWNAGYEPAGFIRFFDRMAHREGYVRGASWFRTHPPFYRRMVESRREIEFLPAKPEAIVQTPEFEDLCRHLEACKVEVEREEKRKDRPSLYGVAREDCPPPDTIDFKAGDPIDRICPASR